MAHVTDQLNTALADRYVIERELGAGGMATVYLARDLKHNRQVALKVLRPELAAVIGAERFLKEIEVTANLQHPHILPLHDSGEASGYLYYVMPFVEGETLRLKLDKEKQLGVEEAVEVTRSVAAALDYAHRKGVIHRDIKPENILIHDGQALVADFGIALAVSQAGGNRLTETGLSIGTPHYMSPEQAMGDRELDARSDVYSLGAMLYEMLAGDPPYTGSTAQAIVAKVITEKAPPVTQHRDTVPAHVAAAITKCLNKLPADRFKTTAEFADALGNARFALPAPDAEPQRAATAVPPYRRTAMVPALAAVAVIATALAAWGWLRQPALPVQPVTRFAVSLPPSEQLYEAPVPLMSVAPDGSGFVYVGVGPMGRRLYWRGFDRFTARPLAGTEDAERPFFSPDGAWIGYRAANRMWKVPLAGGPPRVIMEGPFWGGAWSPDGMIVFGDRAGLSMISADGGDKTQLTTVDSAAGEVGHFLPRMLPGGVGVVFQVQTRVGEPRLAAASLPDGKVTYLGEGLMPTFAPPNHLVYLTRNGLRTVTFDPDRMEVSGTPIPVEADVIISDEPVSEVDVSASGALVYLTRDPTRRSLVEVDRLGRERVLSPDLRGYDGPRYSPDGRLLLTRIQDDEGFNIWVYDFARGTSLRLTFDGGSYYPEWSPDGRRVIFPSSRRGGTALWSKLATGAGSEQQLFESPLAQWQSSWAPDERYGVIRQNDPETGRDLWLVSGPERTLTPLVATPASEHAPKVSPDGRFLAYVSNATGRAEVYVRTLPDSGGTWMVSEGGGTEPLWAPDGRQIFYRNGDAIMAVDIQTRPAFLMGRRDSLFTGSYVPNPTHTNYDVHPSGDRFVMIGMAEGERRAVVVLNWSRELTVGR